jgi:hypothetical protein
MPSDDPREQVKKFRVKSCQAILESCGSFIEQCISRIESVLQSIKAVVFTALNV